MVAVGCVLGEVRTVVQGERGVGGDERGGGAAGAGAGAAGWAKLGAVAEAVRSRIQAVQMSWAFFSSGEASPNSS